MLASSSDAKKATSAGALGGARAGTAKYVRACMFFADCLAAQAFRILRALGFARNAPANYLVSSLLYT